MERALGLVPLVSFAVTDLVVLKVLNHSGSLIRALDTLRAQENGKKKKKVTKEFIG